MNTLNAKELRDSAKHLRLSATSADCLLQSAWLERLAKATEQADLLLEELRKAYERAEAKGKNPDKETTAELGAWHRAVNHRDKLEQAGYMPD